MGNLKRKLKRKYLHETRCCGHQMTYKCGYGYVCETCGKTKKENKDE